MGVGAAEPTRNSSLSPRPASIKGKEKADTASPVLRSPNPGNSVTEDGPSQDEETESEEDDEEAAYEQARQRRILENRALLADLGIEPNMVNAVAGPSQAPAAPAASAPKRKRSRPQHKLVRDRSGYLVSLPPQGEVQRMACVQVPSDRRLRRLISEGVYVDCSDWSIGEARRWRWRDGDGETLQQGERAVVGGVAPDFRWRRWRGLRKELAAERASLEDEVGMERANREVSMSQEGVSAYSLLPAQTCHQCKRRSDKAKMQCRNLKPVCKAVFCETCCKRYSYFDFDLEARSFICPLCRDCCNCSQCLRKRNLAHLLDGKRGIKHILGQQLEAENGGSAKALLARHLSVQDMLERVAVETKIQLPFERVRLVDRVTDVISPELPPEPVLVEAKKRRAKGKTGRTAKTGVIESDQAQALEDGNTGVSTHRRIKKPGRDTMTVTSQTQDGASPAPRLVPTLRKPAEQADPPKEKIYDTDGDTVAGSSDGEVNRGRDYGRASSTSSDITPLSRSVTPVSHPSSLRQMPTLVPDATSRETAMSLDTILIAQEVVKLAPHQPPGVLAAGSMSDISNTPVLTPASRALSSIVSADQTLTPSHHGSERTLTSERASPPPSILSGSSELPSWLISPRQRAFYGLDRYHKSDLDSFSRPQTIDSAVAYRHGYSSMDSAPFLDRSYDSTLGPSLYPPSDRHEDGKYQRLISHPHPVPNNQV